MVAGDVRLNMQGLMEISNIANRKIAEPLAERVAARAGDGYRVERWERPSVAGWARTRVITDTPEAMIREVRTGALARALGGG